jgi:hypothetical protein
MMFNFCFIIITYNINPPKATFKLKKLTFYLYIL